MIEVSEVSIVIPQPSGCLPCRESWRRLLVGGEKVALPRNLHGNLPDKPSDKPPDKLPNKPPDKLPNKPPDKLPDKLSGKLSGKPSNKLPGKPPDKLLDKLPDNLPDKLHNLLQHSRLLFPGQRAIVPVGSFLFGYDQYGTGEDWFPKVTLWIVKNHSIEVVFSWLGQARQEDWMPVVAQDEICRIIKKTKVKEKSTRENLNQKELKLLNLMHTIKNQDEHRFKKLIRLAVLSGFDAETLDLLERIARIKKQNNSRLGVIKRHVFYKDHFTADCPLTPEQFMGGGEDCIDNPC